MGGRIWVLGAADPEMEAIEALLRECGERVAYAIDQRGERVHPASAYRGTSHRYGTDCGPSGDTPETWYLVECDAPTPEGCTRVVIDHHRPGDPGYGRPPAEFLPASSIGQVIAELARLDLLPWERDREPGVPSTPGEFFPWCGHGGGLHEVWVSMSHLAALVPPALVLIAAADHCLGAAYRGECPGVDPDTLMRWRAESRAKFQDRSVEEVLADVERAQEALLGACNIVLHRACRACAGCSIYDGPSREEVLRGPYAAGNCPASRNHVAFEAVEIRDMRAHRIPELPEAATRLGVGYLSGPLASPDGRHKITCSGTAEQVRAFLESWAPREGLIDLYGDPARGFAGGYLPSEVAS